MQTEIEDLLRKLGIDPQKLSRKIEGDPEFSVDFITWLEMRCQEVFLGSSQIIFPASVTKVIDIQAFRLRTYYPTREYPTAFPDTLSGTLSEIQGHSFTAVPVPQSGVSHASIMQQIKRPRLQNTDMHRALAHLLHEQMCGSWIVHGRPAKISSIFNGLPEYDGTKAQENLVLRCRLRRLATWHNMVRGKNFQIPSLLEMMFMAELMQEKLLEGYYITKTIFSEHRLQSSKETTHFSDDHVSQNLIAMIMMEQLGRYGIDIVPVVEMPTSFFLLPIVNPS